MAAVRDSCAMHGMVCLMMTTTVAVVVAVVRTPLSAAAPLTVAARSAVDGTLAGVVVQEVALQSRTRCHAAGTSTWGRMQEIACTR